MTTLFDRWLNKRADYVEERSEVKQKQLEPELDRLRKQVCGELNAILDFLSMLGKNLNDHYMHVRFICNEQVNR